MRGQLHLSKKLGSRDMAIFVPWKMGLFDNYSCELWWKIQQPVAPKYAVKIEHIQILFVMAW